jgi:predicted RNase H-like nuclease (RuvC/YqgF family)
MFMDTPNTLLIVALGAFLLGWLVSRFAGGGSGTGQFRKGDPRDSQIRGLEAELRIAVSECEKAKETLEKRDRQLMTAREDTEKRDNLITGQQTKIAELKRDLKDSVLKTRELRSELSSRAVENVRSEVKLREVETELSVAQASTDMIATGVLDYAITPEPLKLEEVKRLRMKTVS